MLLKRFSVTVLPLVLAGFLSCGLEEYYYLDPVLQDNIVMVFNNKATIQLPGSGANGYNYFTHFTIFYRIYISGIDTVAKIETTDDRNNINGNLSADWNAIYPSTDTTSTTANTSIDRLFNNRKYYQLVFSETSDASVLTNAALGKKIEIDFPITSGVRPTLTIKGATAADDVVYTLYRSNSNTGGGGEFLPQPDRNFLNSPELYDSANARDANKNPDVADNSLAPPPPQIRFTYVSLYIAAEGKDYLTSFFSLPTFIGVFKLPNT
jgi:hypothetical protein